MPEVEIRKQNISFVCLNLDEDVFKSDCKKDVQKRFCNLYP